MKNLEVTKKMSSLIAKTSLQLKKHSPTILVVTGVIGVTVSAVLACKETLKTPKIIERAKEEVSAIQNNPDNEGSRKELTTVYAKTGLQLVMLYLPSIGLGVLSIAMIVASNNILNKRNAAIAAAYATLDKSFKEYRARLVGSLGKEADNELRFNLHNEDIEETIVDEDGKSKKIKKTVQVAEVGNDYARYFDKDTSCAWEPNPDFNRFFLQGQQNYANEKLRAQGYLFLNDVYDGLGIQRSIPGQVVGWVYDNEQEIGDNYIDFGIKEVYKRNAISGELEPVILLDFNVDGSIFNHAVENELVAP